MKRGFLKNNKGTNDTSEVKPTQAAAKHDVVSIPNLRIDIEDVPRIGKIPSGPFSFEFVTLPRPDILRIDRPWERAPVCLLYPGTKKNILAIPNFPVRLPIRPLFGLPYYIKDTPGSGKGVFANIAFQPGELIMCDRPLIVLPLFLPVYANATHPDTFIEKLVEGLTETDRQMFYGFHNCKGNGPMQVRKDIIDTNCLGIGRLPGDYDGAYGAIGRDISRVNHSCIPNVEHRWHLDSMCFELRAIRPIQKDEQVFITYTYLLQSRADRREELLSKYTFECACSSCSLPEQESKRSDIRRSLLNAAYNEIASVDSDRDIRAWASDPSLPDDHVIKHSLKIVGLMEEEGIWDKDIWPVHFALLCKAYCALGNREEAVEWAKKSATLALAFTGSDGGWEKVATAPERTEWWGLRSKSKEQSTRLF